MSFNILLALRTSHLGTFMVRVGFRNDACLLLHHRKQTACMRYSLVGSWNKYSTKEQQSKHHIPPHHHHRCRAIIVNLSSIPKKSIQNFIIIYILGLTFNNSTEVSFIVDFSVRFVYIHRNFCSGCMLNKSWSCT